MTVRRKHSRRTLLSLGGQQFVYGGPRADVAPAGLGGNHGNARRRARCQAARGGPDRRGGFHDGVVHGNTFEARIDAAQGALVARRADGFADFGEGMVRRGKEAAQAVQKGRRAPEEHSRIPKVFSRGGIFPDYFWPTESDGFSVNRRTEYAAMPRGYLVKKCSAWLMHFPYGKTRYLFRLIPHLRQFIGYFALLNNPRGNILMGLIPDSSTVIVRKTCEKGPCPQSCNNAEILHVSTSSSLTTRETLGFSKTLPAKYMTPTQCSKRVWLAPG